jgi:hypothetical protein
MKLKQYRVTAGQYQIGEWTVLKCGHSCWQLRYQDDMVDEYPTLRVALTDAIHYSARPTR